MKKEFCIVIPVYKETLDCTEILSLKQLHKVIGWKQYDVILVAPTNLNIDKYKDIYKNISVEYFDEAYFKSTATYSQLCISYDFYNRFSEYNYMYIYQLDCYLLDDRLEEFCSLNFDYIGSPIFSTDCGWTTQIGGNYVPKVGNGGFSLRNIETFKSLCDPNGEYRTHYNVTDEILKDVAYEDQYFCEYVYSRYHFNLPNCAMGLVFSWDMSADVIYEKWNIIDMPMCIHAWDKNIRFWKKHIEDMNNPEIIEFCEEKHKDFFKMYYDENDSSYR